MLFMMISRPDSLPVVGLIVPFVLLFAVLYSTWRLLGLLKARYTSEGGELRGRPRLGVAISLSTVLLLVLQSLGQLTVKDVATVGAIATIGYLYLTRNRASAAAP
jgi:phosphoglycerol transferase MdoB-like AlkP superfamily enzyme